MTWREKSKSVITEATLVWIDITREVPRIAMPDKLKLEFIAYINNHYPFGAREHFPYTVWLSEMKHLKSQLYAKPTLPIDEGLFAEIESCP